MHCCYEDIAALGRSDATSTTVCMASQGCTFVVFVTCTKSCPLPGSNAKLLLRLAGLAETPVALGAQPDLNDGEAG